MHQVELDVRGLGPPEPLQRALQALHDLPSGDELVLLIDREPLLLFPELVRRGFAWKFDRAADGEHYTVVISRQTAP